jgi:hypothetical protein
MKRIGFLWVLLFAACGEHQANLTPALDSITATDLLDKIKTLSSDDFEGRAPGTEGEQKTIAYLQDQFKSVGLKPGNPDGTYLQNVPLAELPRSHRSTSRCEARSSPSSI